MKTTGITKIIVGFVFYDILLTLTEDNVVEWNFDAVKPGKPSCSHHSGRGSIKRRVLCLRNVRVVEEADSGNIFLYAVSA